MMRLLLRVLALLGSLELLAQEPVIRITVNLVQIDAVVVDSKGKLVTDLTADDFELLQDGKKQKISSFQFVRTESQVAATPQPQQPVDRNAPPPPPNPTIKPGQVQRTMAIVIDDLNMSGESMASARDALKKFVDKRVQPGDLVAIIRTGAGMGALQSFTTDRRQMDAAIARVKWNPIGRAGVSAFAPLGEEPTEAEAKLDEFRDQVYSVGTLGAIRYVVNGLRQLPGRKSVVLVSDGMKILSEDGTSDRVLDALRRLTDLANRASVVIYTVDARGLPTLSMTAADGPLPNTPNPAAALNRMQNQRRKDYFESQNGLNYLANETGGLFFHDNNDIAGLLGKVVDDQQGYYLLGYAPSEETFNKKFHNIKVRVKRSGLKIRSRNGFFGVPDTDAKPVPHTRQEQMLAALTSPFGSGGVPLRLTALFSDNPKQGSFVTGLLHIGAKDLKFTDEEDGWKKASVDVLAITFGDNGQPVDSSDKSFNMRMRGETYEKALRNGLVYTIQHPVKKPGAYQLRCVVRDRVSEVVGSASQFIEVPDVAKGRLALSGLFLKKMSTTPEDDPLANPTLRVFEQGYEMAYIFQVLNAKRSPENKEELEMQLRLYRDGKVQFEGKPSQARAAMEEDPKHMLTGGQLRLGQDLAPGEYVLQVRVTDKLGKPKQNMAAQYIDFEITKPTPKQAAPR